MEYLMSKIYDLVDLKWDTEYFGIPSAKINIYGQLTEESIDEIVSQIKGYVFITLCNYNNNDYNNFLFKNIDNMFLSDVNVHLEKSAENVSVNDSSVEIKNNLSKDDDILDIAASSFVYSRFVNDKNLDQEKKKMLYYNWVNNAFSNPNNISAYIKVWDFYYLVWIKNKKRLQSN